MLDKVRPDVVHITTPPPSHFNLAMDALTAGANVIVEKPLATVHDQVAILLRSASEQKRVLIEDYNYLHNASIQTVLGMARSGELGEIVDVEVAMCVAILADGSPFADRGVPHPCLAMPGGPIADFLPHLASLVHAFLGPHQIVRAHWSKRIADSPIPFDEFRAIVVAERGSASVSFSAHAQPEMFWVRVNGTRMRATVDLFDGTMILNQLDAGPRPIARLRDRLREGRDVRRAARRNLLGKVHGGEHLRRAVELDYPGLHGHERRHRAAGLDAPDQGSQRHGASPDFGGISVLRVLVTGAKGFLGRSVVAALLRRGHDVRALIRPGAQLNGMAWCDRVEVVRADLRAPGSLESAFEGVDVLVHLAARVAGQRQCPNGRHGCGNRAAIDSYGRLRDPPFGSG